MYSQFCYHIQQDEQKRRATMHINRKPGEQVEVDWAGDPATIIDPDTGEIIKASTPSSAIKQIWPPRCIYSAIIICIFFSSSTISIFAISNHILFYRIGHKKIIVPNTPKGNLVFLIQKQIVHSASSNISNHLFSFTAYPFGIVSFVLF